MVLALLKAAQETLAVAELPEPQAALGATVLMLPITIWVEVVVAAALLLLQPTVALEAMEAIPAAVVVVVVLACLVSTPVLAAMVVMDTFVS